MDTTRPPETGADLAPTPAPPPPGAKSPQVPLSAPAGPVILPPLSPDQRQLLSEIEAGDGVGLAWLSGLDRERLSDMGVRQRQWVLGKLAMMEDWGRIRGEYGVVWERYLGDDVLRRLDVASDSRWCTAGEVAFFWGLRRRYLEGVQNQALAMRVWRLERLERLYLKMEAGGFRGMNDARRVELMMRALEQGAKEVGGGYEGARRDGAKVFVDMGKAGDGGGEVVVEDDGRGGTKVSVKQGLAALAATLPGRSRSLVVVDAEVVSGSGGGDGGGV